MTPSLLPPNIRQTGPGSDRPPTRGNAVRTRPLLRQAGGVTRVRYAVAETGSALAAAAVVVDGGRSLRGG